MKRRPRRGGAATLTALVVLAAAVLVAVTAVQLIIGERPWLDYDRIAADLYDTRWRDLAVALTGGGAAVVGLLMLAAALLPGRLTVLPLAGDLDSGASRRSLRGTLRVAASHVDGVESAKVRLRPRRVTAVVRTNRTTLTGLDDAVRDAVEHRLDQVGTRPAVRVRVNAPRSSS